MRSNITETMIKQILSLRSIGLTYKRIGEIVGVSTMCAWEIANGKKRMMAHRNINIEYVRIMSKCN